MAKSCGEMTFYADDKNLLGLTFASNDESVLRSLGGAELTDTESPVIEAARLQLIEYFNGQRKDFDLPLELSGTAFQMRAWESLRTIPFGKVLSYRDQAGLIATGAYRAVGSANGRNPISIIIPCHRVLGSNGKISGYSGGADIKAKLLELEGHTFRLTSEL